MLYNFVTKVESLSRLRFREIKKDLPKEVFQHTLCSRQSGDLRNLLFELVV